MAMHLGRGVGESGSLVVGRKGERGRGGYFIVLVDMVMVWIVWT